MSQLENLMNNKEIIIKDCIDPNISRKDFISKYKVSTRALYDFMKINNITWVAKPHNGANQFTRSPINKIIENRVNINGDLNEGLSYNSPIDFLNFTGIYRIVSATGGVYIGAANWSFRKRFNEHKNMLSKRVHHCLGLQRAYNNTPKALFEVIEVIKGDSYNYIYGREEYYWNYYKDLNYKIYNGKPIGRSLKHTLESREKISQSKTLEFTDEEITNIYKLYVLEGKSKYEIGRKILHVSDKRLNNLISNMGWGCNKKK